MTSDVFKRRRSNDWVDTSSSLNCLEQRLLHECRELYLLLKCNVVRRGAFVLFYFYSFLHLLGQRSYKHRRESCVPIESYRVYILPSSSPRRWTDEHGGEEEEEAAQEQDHLQQQPAPGSGESVWEDTLPRRLRQRGPGPPGQPHRGQSPGNESPVNLTRPLELVRDFDIWHVLPFKIKAWFLEVWRFPSAAVIYQADSTFDQRRRRAVIKLTRSQSMYSPEV